MLYTNLYSIDFVFNILWYSPVIPRCAAWRTDSERTPRPFRDMRTSLWLVWWRWCCRAACCPEYPCVSVVYRRDRSFTSRQHTTVSAATDLRNICKQSTIGICDVSDILKRDEQFLSKQINSREMLFSTTFPFSFSHVPGGILKQLGKNLRQYICFYYPQSVFHFSFVALAFYLI